MIERLAVLYFVDKQKLPIMICPCSPKLNYKDCCQPFHQGKITNNAEQLMRSRYTAFTLGKIDYIVDTTVTKQQYLLNKQELSDWSENTDWQKLVIHEHIPKIGKRHAQVNFEAFYLTNDEKKSHCELSTFVTIDNRWYFVDPTPMNITNKQPLLL